jgi:lipid-A-disaccharide synthase
MGLPGVIVYRMSGLTYRIAKALVSVEHIGMVNLLLGERVLPELIQDEASPKRIANELESFLINPELFQRTKEKLSRLKSILGTKDAYGYVAGQLLEVYL